MRTLTSLFLFLLLAGGLLIPTASYALTSHGNTVTLVTMDDPPFDDPITLSWVAFQDGNGPWTRINPRDIGTYTQKVRDPLGRYGFALIDQQGILQIIQGRPTPSPLSPVTTRGHRMRFT